MPQQSRGKAANNSKRRPPEEREKVPDWPALQPLVPTTDLALETLLEDQIILIRNLFTSTLCKRYVSFLSSLPLITTPAKPKEGEALRVNGRIQFDDPVFAEQLWSSTGLRSLASGSAGNVDPHALTIEGAKKLWGGEVCGLNPRIRVYRYCQCLPPSAALSLSDADFCQAKDSFLVRIVCILKILIQTPPHSYSASDLLKAFISFNILIEHLILHRRRSLSGQSSLELVILF